MLTFVAPLKSIHMTLTDHIFSEMNWNGWGPLSSSV